MLHLQIQPSSLSSSSLSLSYVSICNPNLRLTSKPYHLLSSRNSIAPATAATGASSSSSSFSSLNFPLLATTNTKKFSLKCRQSDYFGQQKQQKFTAPKPAPTDSSFASSPPDGAGGGAPSSSLPRVFVGHSIYKGKAALTVEPRAPEFAALDSGAFKVSKDGFVLLQFAPASGLRQYDWSRKQVFSLSIAEIGSLISLGAKDSCEFFHDPFKGRSDEGKVRKVLKIEPLPDGSGHFFNLSVQNKLLNMDESIYIPVTKAEYAILVSAFNFILPYLLGWHAFANAIKSEDSNNCVDNANPRSTTVDYEWNR